MAPMPLADALFLIGESRENPMHVGGLQLFTPPDGAGPEYLNDAYHELLAADQVDPMFRRRPRRPLTSLGQWSWERDDELDLEYHVRLSALPRPGRVRELLELTSRLHGSLLDRRRPLWEFHLFEGLADGRFATYTKVHHSLVDGVSALRLLRRALSEDPDARDLLPPWVVGPDRSGRQPGAPAGSAGWSLGDPLQAIGAAARAAGEVVSTAPALVNAVRKALGDQASALPFQAPRSMLNVEITGARRFAAQSWPFQRIRAVQAATGGTVNDVVLAMCAGALRSYLLELGALPDRPLIAMVPVSLRTGGGGSDAGGNALGTILCNLATDVADPVTRYEQVRTSMRHGKQTFDGLTALQVMLLSALVIAPLAAAGVPGAVRMTPPPFNLVISNMPGPKRPLYWNGARLRGLYPLSIPIDGLALNLTITSYVDSVEFGLTGCRRRVPHLQRMLGHLEVALAELETAIGC